MATVIFTHDIMSQEHANNIEMAMAQDPKAPFLLITTKAMIGFATDTDDIPVMLAQHLSEGDGTLKAAIDYAMEISKKIEEREQGEADEK